MAKISNKIWNEAQAMNALFDAPSVDCTDFVGDTVLTMDMATPEVFDAVLEHQDPEIETSDIVETNPGEFSTTLDMDTAEKIDEDNIIEALEVDEATEASVGPRLDAVCTDPEPQAHTAADFDARLAAITDEDAVAKAIEIGKEIDKRAEFERSKGNETIQKHLAKSRKQLATPRAARVVIACNVDVSEINRSVHEGVCYNVYALGKLADAIVALSGGVLGNAINVACMKSLFQFRAAGAIYNGEMAKASASDKIRVEVGLRGMLVRHTVAASTASTQASSTMQALTTLGVVKRSGSQKNPVFDLTDTDIVAKLDSVVMAKAA